MPVKVSLDHDPLLDKARDQARFLGNYTRQYNAGAFAHPTAGELARHPELVRDERAGSERAVVCFKTLSRDTQRTDFTGYPIVQEVGKTVATHVARTPNYMPDLHRFDYVQAYAEDRDLSATLRAMGFGVLGSRVTSAAEVINVWSADGRTMRYRPHDAATVVEMPIPISDDMLRAMTDELAVVDGWDDDFPYYSDGGWSAVCLKGFWPNEPGKGVKPTEMPKSWKAEHRADLARKAEWTTLSSRTPALVNFVRSVPWMERTERVRLLKMKAGSKLGRHTDITDREGGTRDGMITRFHIPLITHRNVALHTWDLDGIKRDHYLSAGRCFYLDARKPHAVTHGGGSDRIHLVVDVVTDERVRSRIAAAYQNAA